MEMMEMVKNDKGLNFKELLSSATAEVTVINDEIRKAKDALSKLEKVQREKQLVLNTLRRIKSMASYTDKGNYYKWTTEKYGGSSYYKTARKEVDTFKSLQYDFTTVLSERTDLKKMKWEANVYGTKTYVTDASNSWDSNSYRDNAYVENLYGKEQGLTLELKFSSEADARAFISQMKQKLEDDHKVELDSEKLLIEKAKLLPIVQVGSKVRSALGEGVVTQHRHSDVWNVDFSADENARLRRVMPLSESDFELIE